MATIAASVATARLRIEPPRTASAQRPAFCPRNGGCGRRSQHQRAAAACAVPSSPADGTHELGQLRRRRRAEQSAGGPISWMRPWCMNTTWCRTSRAKLISCVTISSVMPSAASSSTTRQHLADQLGVERRGDLVAQQHHRLHRQRARDRHALLLAARQLVGQGVELLGQADALAASCAPCASASALAASSSPRVGASITLRPARQVREQIELLEDHARPAGAARCRSRLVRQQRRAVDGDRALVEGLQAVDAAQQRALARAALADDGDRPRRRSTSRSMPFSTSLSPKRFLHSQ